MTSETLKDTKLQDIRHSDLILSFIHNILAHNINKNLDISLEACYLAFTFIVHHLVNLWFMKRIH